MVARGVVQRVRALEAFLADVYGTQEVLRDGVVPRRVVVSSSAHCRPAYGVTPPNGVRIHVSGIDLVRDEAGEFRVLEDNVRTPSGVSNVVENRRAMARVFPELLATHRVRPVDAYPTRLLHALRAAAPAGIDDPTVVVLTPGGYNSAYFEHSLLARLMGVELVEGRDRSCRDGVVWMRTTAGEQRVDVVYRRLDDDYLDPLHFRQDSLVGCPGILNAARAGQVTIANAVGNGVADDKLLYTYVPELIRYYLNEEPVLPNIDTHRLEDPEECEWVLAHLDELVPPGTSTCGPSQSTTASRSGWSLAVSPGSRCRKAHSWSTRARAAGARTPGSSPVTRASPRTSPGARSSRPGIAARMPWTAAPTRTTSSSEALQEPRMLSRVAESLYWIGRYVERAEDTSRLLDVHVHTLLEDPWVDGAGASRDVLAVMGVEVPSGLLDARRTTEWLAFRPGDTSSIVGALAAARENALGGSRGVVQRAVGGAEHHLPRAARPGGAGPPARTARLLPLRPGAGRRRRRVARRDDAPRRGMAVPGAWPFPRTRRHDGPAALVARPAARRERRLGGPAEELQRS